MTEVNHNSLMYLTPEDHVAMAVYLKSVVNEDPLYIEPSDAPPSLGRGQQVYHKVCVICHQEGAMSAPLIGSAPSWFSRLKDSDIDTLYRHVINGYNSMPVRGACISCSDNDIKSAVDYILDKSLTRSQWLDVYRPHHSSPTTN
jgi:cytochrome c5